MKTQVRCSCPCGELRGYVNVPASRLVNGNHVGFPIASRYRDYPDTSSIGFDTARLEVRMVETNCLSRARLTRQLVLASDDSIENLRRIHSFVEV